MTEPLEIGLLGAVEAHLDGRRVTPTSVAQRVVLAALALTAGRAVSAAFLAEALWGDEQPANATGNLQTYVSRLRRVIGTERITHEPAGYRLHLRPEQVDIGRVELLVADARAVSVSDPARAAALLGDALATWRGEPLSDLADRLAFAPTLARLAAWHEQLQQEWLGLRLAAGEAADAVPALQEAVMADPMSEGLHLLLIRALHQTRRTAEALAIADGFRRRLAEDTGLDPSPAFTELQSAVLSDDPELRIADRPVPAEPPERPPRPTPARRRAPGDRFIGRQTDIDQVVAALGRRRVVSIVGPGGVGKTRLLLELLDRLGDLGHPGEERFLVELSEMSPAADVSVSVAAALGLQAAPDGFVSAITGRLGGQPALLVLDNCEHVLAAVRELTTELLTRCPGLRVLSTSRQRLGLADEQVIRLGPLPELDQVELFFDRASLLRPDLEVSEQTRALVADICRAIDGLPLAVELAARREAVFGLSQLRDRLLAGLEVLDPAREGDRSTAVTATVEWSYRLIDPDAQALFDRLAVCRGGFSLDALSHLAPSGLSHPAALLAELVEASLVVADLTGEVTRYRMLEMMRHVGLGHLTPDGLVEAHRAHAEMVLAVVMAVDERQRYRSPEAIPLFRREIVGIREALAWLIDTAQWDQAARLGTLVAMPVADDPDLALLAQLERFDPVADRFVDGTLDPGDETAARCCLVSGVVAWFGGDARRADRLLGAALGWLGTDHPELWLVQLFSVWNRMFIGEPASVADEVGRLLADRKAPTWARANAVCCTAMLHLFSGDRDNAERWMTEHQELLAEVIDLDGLVACTYGELAADRDTDRALAWFEQAYQRCDEHGHRFNREVAGVGRTAVLIRLGRHHEAIDACHRLIDNVWRMGMWPQTWTAVRLAAELLVALGDPEPAATLLAAADADRLAPAVLGPDLDRQAELWASIRESLDAPTAAATGQRAMGGGRTGTVRLALAALDRHR